MAKFLQFTGTIKRTAFRKGRTETTLKTHNTLIVPTLYMGQKIGLWQLHREELSGRNEIIATSGRLRPSRPQNKRLYTPWTKNYSHTRQDRWIQTELAFTLAKNATKPDPVEIISLQTTRKKNNWKTEETLARTVVTLETERIKLVQSLMYIIIIIITRIQE